MRKEKLRYSRIGMVVGLLIALLGMGILFPPTPSAGQGSKNGLPVVDGETQLFPGYPRQFDGAGFIDRLGEKEVVIGDILLPLPSSAQLHTPRSSSASISRFAEGDYVGYQRDDSGAIESLWLLQKEKR